MAEKSEKRSSVVATGSDPGETTVVSKDEYQLAALGYKQEFFRKLGLFENWASVFTAMNFVSGIPGLLGWILYTGGPSSAFTNWILAGVMSINVSFVMAEIAAALPTAGGIYFWSYRLGGKKWGVFLSWMTAWWNWTGWVCSIPGVQQATSNYLLSALQIKYPDSELLHKAWFAWVLTAIGMIFATLPNIISPRVLKWYLRFAVVSAMTLFFSYSIWVPAKTRGRFRSAEEVFQNFNNGINFGTEQQASDSYVWVIGLLFGAWVFYGYDACAHLAEETKEASTVVARGMWLSTFSSWIISVPILIIILFSIQDATAIINSTYNNTFAEYLIQIIGENGAVAVLVILAIDSTCVTAANLMSAQRVTFAISRDGLLPFSKYFRKLNRNKVPVNAALLCSTVALAICCAVIGSTTAFSAINATGTIAANVSYLFPIIARNTIGRTTANAFVPAKWNLGKLSPYMGLIASCYITYLFTVLLLPQEYPVNIQTLNYSPICIGIVTGLSLIGWFLPFGLGGRYWFHGPKRTIDEREFRNIRVQEVD